MKSVWKIVKLFGLKSSLVIAINGFLAGVIEILNILIFVIFIGKFDKAENTISNFLDNLLFNEHHFYNLLIFTFVTIFCVTLRIILFRIFRGIVRDVTNGIITEIGRLEGVDFEKHKTKINYINQLVRSTAQLMVSVFYINVSIGIIFLYNFMPLEATILLFTSFNIFLVIYQSVAVTKFNRFSLTLKGDLENLSNSFGRGGLKSAKNTVSVQANINMLNETYAIFAQNLSLILLALIIFFTSEANLASILGLILFLQRLIPNLVLTIRSLNKIASLHELVEINKYNV